MSSFIYSMAEINRENTEIEFFFSKTKEGLRAESSQCMECTFQVDPDFRGYMPKRVDQHESDSAFNV